MAASREWLEKDYYAALGVSKSATQAEIKKAYRRLAQKHHPDANPGDKEAEERFKEVSAAYDVLGDEKRRAEYDRVREMASAGFGGGFGGGPGGAGGARVRFEDLGGFGDLFGDLFGGGFGAGAAGPRRGPQRGVDLETEVRISFDQAMEGATVPVRVAGPAPCEMCGGSGAKPGTSVRTCTQCGGSGTVAIDQGMFSIAQPCPRCGGSGREIEEPCPTCRGSGTQRRTRTLRVRIPAGVDDGARIRLAGRGEPGGPGGRPGDLYVVVRVSPHERFGRKGSNLTVEIPVTYPEAALGAKVEVPTLNGPVTLKVPAGTPSGKTFRIRGRGIPKRRGGKGDLLATVKVAVPSKVSKKERELLEQLREVSGEGPRPRAS
ncbi:MAG TPA: molecular chaperone DnaJ [Actinomycetota bacterium]